MTQQWIDFRLLKERLSFEEVLQHYKIELKRKNGSSGHQLHGFCPLPNHNGQKKSPSFSVNVERKCFQCFGCQAKGNHLDLAVLMEGKSPSNRAQVREVALMLVKAFGIECDQPGHDNDRCHGSRDDNRQNDRNGGGGAANTASPSLHDRSVKQRPSTPKSSSQAAANKKTESVDAGSAVVINAPLDFQLKGLDPQHPYLLERGFTAETIMHFGLGFCNRGLMAGRVVIPLHDPAGKLIGYAGRFTRDDQISDKVPKYLFPSNRERNGTSLEFRKSLFLYNGDAIKSPVNDLIIVEGFASVWWLTQCGYPDSVALMGNSCSDEQAELVLKLVAPSGRVWVIPDAGEGGDLGAESVVSKIVPHRLVRWIVLENGQPTDRSPEELARLLEVIQ